MKYYLKTENSCLKTQTKHSLGGVWLMISNNNF